jgi:pyruvate,water dikinase
MLNVASPGLAFQFSHLPNKGVGLAREEFIINNYIGIHPLALMNHRSLDDMLSKEIEHKITGYPDEETFFIEKLASGVAKLLHFIQIPLCVFLISKAMNIITF